jgi:solute carrier family 5 (sodium-dependent multivitamin transporter), member 6
LSKKYTVVWGVICVLLAFSAGNIAPTVIEAINKIGSLFYGPIIATFMLAVLTKSVTTNGINLGIFSGVIFNLLLWIFAEELIFWFWWNATGFIVTTTVAIIHSRYIKKGLNERNDLVLAPVEFRWKESSLLVAYFIGIVLFSVSLAFWI